MIKHRLHHMEDGKSITTDATQIYDLNFDNVISRLTFQLKLQGNTDQASTGHPAAALTKVEIVDGSKVLWGLDGHQLHALDFYGNNRSGHRRLDYINDVACIWVNSINFGRFLWDPVLGFDPRKFNNPQLRITHNYDLGGMNPDVGELDVWAQLYHDERPEPVGFLSAREHHVFTAGDGAVKYIDLPVDMVIRKIVMSSLYTGKMPHEQYNKLRLDLNNDAVLIFDESVSDLAKNCNYNNGPYLETMLMDGSGTARIMHITPTYETILAQATLHATAGYAAAALSYGGTVSIKGNTDLATQWVISGHCPHGCVEIPFGKENDIEDWLALESDDHLRLKITCGSSIGSADVGTILEQLYKY